ncbi:MAG: hypothetical protein ABI954_12990 [Pyrinomonadaceae bacterium]
MANPVAKSNVFFVIIKKSRGRGIKITPTLCTSYVRDALMVFAHQATRLEAKVGDEFAQIKCNYVTKK